MDHVIERPASRSGLSSSLLPFFFGMVSGWIFFGNLLFHHVSKLGQTGWLSAYFLAPVIAIACILIGNSYSFTFAWMSGNSSFEVLGYRAMRGLLYGRFASSRAQILGQPFFQPININYGWKWLAFTGPVIATCVGASVLDTIVSAAIGKQIVAPIRIADISTFLWIALNLVVVSVLIETVMAVAILYALDRLFQKPQISFCVSVGFWAALHAYSNSPVQALSAAWMFSIFLLSYRRAFAVAGRGYPWFVLFCMHALNNLLALSLIVLNQCLASWAR